MLVYWPAHENNCDVIIGIRLRIIIVLFMNIGQRMRSNCDIIMLMCLCIGQHMRIIIGICLRIRLHIVSAEHNMMNITLLIIGICKHVV
jgi:hypothetical protein